MSVNKYCHLCGMRLTVGNKCESHIIPKFIWKEFMGKDGERQEMVLLNLERPRILRRYGVTDNNILCRKCDGEILGKYENDFKEIWERVFKEGETCPIDQNGHLLGWEKKLSSHEDIIKTKLFMLCCLWRASISNNKEHSLKLSARRENAIRRELRQQNHDRLLYRYSMLCSRFEDGGPDVVIAPYCTHKNKLQADLCYLHLPRGFIFVMKLGAGVISKDLEACKFGASRQSFFIINAGKTEGSKIETALLQRTLVGLQDMYGSDKKEIKSKLLSSSAYNDLSKKDVDNVFQ